MARIKYDVSDVEPGGRNYLQPQPGLYDAKIVELNDRRNQDGKNDIEVVVELTGKGEFQGARLWSYVSFSEASRWKLREFSDALGKKTSDYIDTVKDIGKKLKIKVSAGSYEGEYKARLQRFLSPSDAVDGEDEEDEDEAGEGEDYSEWSLDDLKAEVEERGLNGNITGRKTKEKLIEALVGDDAGPATDEDEEEEEEDDKPEDDYDEWDEEELVSEVKDRELKITGRKTKEKYIAALRADDKAPF